MAASSHGQFLSEECTYEEECMQLLSSCTDAVHVFKDIFSARNHTLLQGTRLKMFMKAEKFEKGDKEILFN